eukprot:5491479-Amphidinium_carterae.1
MSGMHALFGAHCINIDHFRNDFSNEWGLAHLDLPYSCAALGTPHGKTDTSGLDISYNVCSKLRKGKMSQKQISDSLPVSFLPSLQQPCQSRSNASTCTCVVMIVVRASEGDSLCSRP